MSPFHVYRNDELAGPARAKLMARSTAAVFDPELNESVRAIVEDVRGQGDAAIVRALERHDGVTCPPERLRVSAEEIVAASDNIPDELARAIRLGIANIRRYNERIVEAASWSEELEPGVVLGEQANPIVSAGLVVPSGKGSFPSVLMHLGTPAVSLDVAGRRKPSPTAVPSSSRTWKRRSPSRTSTHRSTSSSPSAIRLPSRRPSSMRGRSSSVSFPSPRPITSSGSQTRFPPAASRGSLRE